MANTHIVIAELKFRAFSASRASFSASRDTMSAHVTEIVRISAVGMSADGNFSRTFVLLAYALLWLSELLCSLR